jgi:hypothetical protein
MNWAKLETTAGGLKFTSSYDPGLVSSLKASIPAAARRWDHANKAWIVAPQYAATIAGICKANLGVDVQLPIADNTRPQTQQRLLRVEYIGQLKDRGDGSLTAYGLVFPQDDWAAVFSEAVLREWFEGDNQRQSPVMTTYYSLLAVKRTATDEEIKTAWRKMVKRYHPDVNKDDDAHDMTRKINDAYKALRDPMLRRRYDAGLTLADSTAGNEAYKANRGLDSFTYWRAPIRCGLILATGYVSLGRFVVEQINEWLDITENGLTLVTSWDVATNSLRREWI